MTPVKRNAVFTFESTHEAMAAEDVLRRAGVAFEVVPPPREITAGCGLALRIALADLALAVDAFAVKDTAWQAVYELGPLQEIVAKLG